MALSDVIVALSGGPILADNIFPKSVPHGGLATVASYSYTVVASYLQLSCM